MLEVGIMLTKTLEFLGDENWHQDTLFNFNPEWEPEGIVGEHFKASG